MGYNARNDEIRDNITRMQRAWEAERVALATVRALQCNAFGQGLLVVLAENAAVITAASASKRRTVGKWTSRDHSDNLIRSKKEQLSSDALS